MNNLIDSTLEEQDKEIKRIDNLYANLGLRSINNEIEKLDNKYKSIEKINTMPRDFFNIPSEDQHFPEVLKDASSL